MNKVKYRLKGHETFILREGWLTKGLNGVQDDAFVFTRCYGADALGVGSNMAKAIRYWLKAGGFTQEKPKCGVTLTEIGEAIYQNDVYFEDDFSYWIFHCNLALNREFSTSWYVFWNMLEDLEFSKEELELQLRRGLEIYTGTNEIAASSVEADASAIINMYCRLKDENYDPEEKKISPFAHLKLMNKNLDKYRKNHPDAGILSADVVLYLLEKYFCGRTEDSISIERILKDKELPGKILNLNRTALNDYLDELSDRGYITVNRTAGLDMVYLQKRISPEDVVKLHFQKGN